MGKTNILLPVLGAAVILTGTLATANTVHAEEPIQPFQSIIQKIAQKFNLKETEVKAVFDEMHEERVSQMKKTVEEKLTQAASDGKITGAQKTALLNKWMEMKTNALNHEQFKTMTPEQKRQTMEKKKTDLENWGRENGLTLETIHSLFGHRFGHKGFGIRHFK